MGTQQMMLGTYGGFTPATLFAASEQGAWYEPGDFSTLFQDAAGTTPVTAVTQPVGRINDKSGRGNHATQATAPARPLYQTTPARMVFDKVDDLLAVTVPAGGWVGTMVLGTTSGTAAYGVNILAGAYTIGAKSGIYFPGTAIVGQVVRHVALTAGEITSVVSDMVTKGATPDYGAVTNFTDYWRGWTELTSFPLINTAAGTSFGYAWFGCSGLTSFSLINTAAGTGFGYAWFGCTGLASFPLINTAAGTSFGYAWYNCFGLTSFPLINTAAGTTFDHAWFGCSGLTSFPANAFDAVKGGDFTSAFANTALTQASIDGILTSLVTSGIAAGTRVFDQSGGSAPSVATGQPAITTLRSRGWTVTVTGGF